MIAVSDIRNQGVKITNQPIIYYWWFKTSSFEKLFALLKDEIDFNRIANRMVNHETYGLLYIGKGKNGNDRLVKYHIHDSSNFHTKGVENGRLSSLRQTLCGLLQLPMSTSKYAINSFMDEYCMVEYEVCSLEDLDRIEYEKITGNYLPLNHQNTKHILSSNHRRILSTCKKMMKK
jgi:hypothetical protein